MYCDKLVAPLTVQVVIAWVALGMNTPAFIQNGSLPTPYVKSKRPTRDGDGQVMGLGWGDSNS
jgi:hypothetical protein